MASFSRNKAHSVTVSAWVVVRGSRYFKAEAQGRRADAVIFYGLAEEFVMMARLLGREIADRLRPNADSRAFWKV